MIQLTQRQIHHGVFGLMTFMSIVTLIWLFISQGLPETIIANFIYTGSCGVLWFAYWRGWDPARPTSIVLLSLIVGFGLPDTDFTRVFNTILYIVPVLALVLTSPGWILGSALTILAIFFYRSGIDAPVTMADVTGFIVIIGGMMLSRIAFDNSKYLELAKREAEEAQAQAEAERQRAEQKSTELEQRNVEQQRLLELVTLLETPTITVANGVLLAPIVGSLDSQRAQALTTRLLKEVNASRTRHVILDIAGVTAVDTKVAQALLQTAQALRLLGCEVTLTGISAMVATTLTHLGVALDHIHIARSPQDVLNNQQTLSL
jgi:anti-anti-sigma regulatory factor